MVEVQIPARSESRNSRRIEGWRGQARRRRSLTQSLCQGKLVHEKTARSRGKREKNELLPNELASPDNETDYVRFWDKGGWWRAAFLGTFPSRIGFRCHRGEDHPM